MTSYPVDVGGILHDLGAMVHIDDRVPLEDLDTEDTRFRLVEPPRVVATLTNAGDGVVLNGTVSATIESDCVRCLEPFTFDLDATLEGLFTTPEKAEELPEDQEWEPLGGEVVDIAPAVESSLRLELPFAPLHAEDCAGICPVCGCNRNEKTCDCDTTETVPGPFDELRGLFAETDQHDAGE